MISISPPFQLTYRDTSAQIERLRQTFCEFGIDAGDCVVIFLHNGVALPVIFLALASARIIAAPVNPAYKSDELQAAIEDCRARAVIAAPSDEVARDAATRAAVPLWQSSVDEQGNVKVAGGSSVGRRRDEAAGVDDVALYMRTSGTTGRPKTVPLTHGNVMSSTLHIAANYGLGPADRTLLVMPLFHGHGLIGATLSTLSSGGAVILPPRFSATDFWPLVAQHGITWYSAVPTIHQILLLRADDDAAPSKGLRFIRSCSASLAPAVLSRLEARFGAPVIEAYGMTETSHQAASNPLPPHPHSAGTVGFASGVDIGIIDGAGRRQPAGVDGEVVVRGPSVMRGYLDNPEANAAAFIDGWFRSGDMGVLDGEGCLRLTGRIKDLINRGGEKISPGEIEQVLQAHPAVQEVSVFGKADAKYGEVVWAAVVLRGKADAAELQDFCRARLADFKVPAEIRFVTSLPRNPTGKIVRSEVSALFTSTPN